MDDFMVYYGQGAYDWRYENRENKTPEESPYSFGEFFVWRDFDKFNFPKDVDSFYDDRMREWKPEKFKEAFKGVHWASYRTLSKERCKKIIKEYFEGEVECVGLAVGCNRGNGYPYAIFYVKKLES